MNLRDLDRAALRDAVAPFGVGADVAGRLFSVVHRDGSSVLDDRTVRGLSKQAAAGLAGATTWPEL